ncbi:hypothetical protein F5144DRAFT_616347 [Chaetomium tenue]|uniref:Uncharacterized protein n=1 Tax=Chaetomium tenue TaxID=1854479 RepID=A0ACB7NU82_9PEZI|nr:hypothetical protein F5144DRAFT_616347 [Chaetomium globosum]
MSDKIRAFFGKKGLGAASPSQRADSPGPPRNECSTPGKFHRGSTHPSVPSISEAPPQPPPKDDRKPVTISPLPSPLEINPSTASTTPDVSRADAADARPDKVTPLLPSSTTSGPRNDPLKAAPPPSTPPKPQCPFCEASSAQQIWSCSSPRCDGLLFCDFHWSEHLLHKKRAATGLGPHCKIDGKLSARLMQALEPPKVEDLEGIHQVNEMAAWFGVERFGGTGTPPVLRDYGRIADLMNYHAPNLAPQERDHRTPSLVSFVGGTGAGKSTVIKILIVLAQALDAYDQSPVMGRAESTVSTSEDVHLYQDPETAKGASPILFADCEGLGGSEPQAAKLRSLRWRSWHQWKEGLQGAGPGGTTPTASPPTAPEPRRVVLERPIGWDKADGGENGDGGGGLWSRGDFVRDLYPRLLYTFSDVVVYVLGASDHKTMQQAMAHLISWADVAVRTSSNQPVLPNAIVVLNSSDQDIPPDLWDVSKSTEKVFEDFNEINYEDDADEFVKFAKAWLESGNGTRITTIKDLALRYYSSVQIIRLPNKAQPARMLTQAAQLRSCISDASLRARNARLQSRMLLDVEQLQGYFHDALSHFARTLKEPFDFVQASFRHSPIPADFSGNVLRLALNVTDPTGVPRRLLSQRLESGLFEVSYAVASSILLNSTRHGNMGNAAALFSQYSGPLQKAIERYGDKYWPCEFESRTGHRCVNLRSGHAKGHQSRDGWILSPGSYTCSADWDALQAKFLGCASETQWRTPTEPKASRQEHLSNNQKAAARIHRERILPNFIARVKQLPHGDKQTEETVCPLRSQKSCLGGIRGIAELEVLLHIEEALGGRIPIQSFFDLIVGTSTGGLVALGLTSMNWTVKECIEKFEVLCDAAFTKKRFAGRHGVLAIVDALMSSRYKTGPFVNALQKAFPKDLYLFSDANPRTKSRVFSTRVAVTTTGDGSAPRTHLLANYNHPVVRREGTAAVDYHFQRPDRRMEEIKVWQAARATSAAPGYFKPFHHKETSNVYFDGAFFHNNPVQIANQERELLWPNSDQPDILLSLGAGKAEEPEKKENTAPTTPPKERTIFGNIQRKFNLLQANLDANLDCDLAWQNFERSQASKTRRQHGQKPDKSSCSNLIRLNPEVPGSIPELDEKDKLTEFRGQVRDWATKKPQSEKIAQVARLLIASSFYFETNTRISSGADADSVKEIQGRYPSHVLCQMPHRRDITELGLHLETLITKRQTSLSFVVSSTDGDTNTETEQTSEPFTLADVQSMIHITQQSLRAFKKYLSFKVKLGLPMRIYLQFTHGPSSKTELYLISSFPRLPRHLRQMAPMRVANLNLPGLVDLATESNSPEPATVEQLAVDWSAPDLERYPDPKFPPTGETLAPSGVGGLRRPRTR